MDHADFSEQLKQSMNVSVPSVIMMMVWQAKQEAFYSSRCCERPFFRMAVTQGTSTKLRTATTANSRRDRRKTWTRELLHERRCHLGFTPLSSATCFQELCTSHMSRQATQRFTPHFKPEPTPTYKDPSIYPLHMSLTNLHNLVPFAYTSQRFDIAQSVPRSRR